MPQFVRELNNLDFSIYIGGPLQAAVEAQYAASLAQVKFIQDVGFETVTEAGKEVSRVRYTEFSYMKKVPNEGNTALVTSETTVNLPFLAMLNVPSLRIDELTIDFNVKLESVETYSSNTYFNHTSTANAGFFIAKFKASTSYTRTSSSGARIEKEYNLSVHVRAVNDELPAGLDRIFNLLEDGIVGSEN